MPKKHQNNYGERSTEKELLPKSKEILVKYILRLEADWFEFRTENEKLHARILELEKSPKKEIVNAEKYNKKLKWIDKLIFIIERNKKDMSVQEIKTQLLILEPEVKFIWIDIDNQISQLLYKAYLSKTILRKKIKDGNRYLYNIPLNNA